MAQHFTHLLISTEGTGKPIDHYTTATPTTQIDNPNLDTGSDQDLFGYAVSTSGTKMVVGAPHEDAAGFANSGKAYYYNGSTTPTFVFDNPSDGTPDYFGFAVDIDGANIVIGAHGDDDPETDSGKVYFYNVQGYFPTVPDITFTNPSDQNGGTGFGTQANDKFGYAVAVKDDFVVIGAPYEDNTGAEDAGRVYVYRISTTTINQTLTQPSPGNNEYFGQAVACDGKNVIVGAPGSIVDPGAAYLFDAAAGGLPLLQFTNPNVDDGDNEDNFGTSVAVSGKYVIIGAPNEDTSFMSAEHSGVAYVYDITSGTPTTPILTLLNPDRALTGEHDTFGKSVDIDGIHAIVGAPGTDGFSGTAYVFDITGGSPMAPVETITNPTPLANDLFGCSVSISGASALVGAEGANTAYPYDLS